MEGEGRDRNYVNTVVIYEIIKENNNNKKERQGAQQSPSHHRSYSHPTFASL